MGEQCIQCRRIYPRQPRAHAWLLQHFVAQIKFKKTMSRSTSQGEPRLRVLIVGASGTLGCAISAELAPRHDIVSAGRDSGEVRFDYADSNSLRRGLATVGRVDAIVCAAGGVHFGALEEMTEDLYAIGIRNKLMGQVNLALLGREILNDGGSITLSSGILAEQPIRYGSSATMVNGAIEGFVRAAAIELDRGLRINAVSPNVVQESMAAYAPYFRGFEPVSAARAALGYARSVEGAQTGQIYKVF
jgi:NAD(P)-dependent dehydrogenase (short-subunit alcohol dehydrogenase family)